ncbi:MAG: YlxR family protein [Lachnospiraceae bacterium]|nr:YlxR family protein [Lachnospiraceae bacterium]
MKTRKIPMRKCTGCGNVKEKKDLIRILHTPEDEIVIDASGKQNGRGAYLCKDLACFQKAYKTKALERSLKTTVPEDVYEKLKEELSHIEG